MRRRAFMLGLGVAAAIPRISRAQPVTQIYRVGVLSPETPPPGLIEILRGELRALGYGEGKVGLEVRHAEGKHERLARLAHELIELKVDVIVTVTTPAAQAAKAATATIPIVMTR